MQAQARQVIAIERSRITEAVQVLRRAFMPDPLMRYLFDDQGVDYGARLSEFIRYTCEVHLQLSWMLLGLIPRTRLAGVAAVALPEQPAWPDSLRAEYSAWIGQIEQPVRNRIEHYTSRTTRHFIDEPLFYVSMIGVRPESQGQGYARQLLEAVHRRSEMHPSSTGVGLDTENEANVAVYERLGYRVIAQESLGSLTIWCLFRPNHAQAAQPVERAVAQ